MQSTKKLESHLLTHLENQRNGKQLSPRQLEILDAAAELVCEHGLESLSLRGLASRVGVSLPSIQHHFGNKDGLINALLEWGIEWYDSELIKATESLETDPVGAFRGVMDCLTDDITEKPNALEFHLWACATYNDHASTRLTHFIRVYTEIVYDLLSRIGTISSDQLRWQRAKNILELIQGSYMLRIASRDVDRRATHTALHQAIELLAQIDQE